MFHMGQGNATQSISGSEDMFSSETKSGNMETDIECQSMLTPKGEDSMSSADVKITDTIPEKLKACFFAYKT